MSDAKTPKYYVHTGEGTDALGIALDSWRADNGGWQGLSVFRLPYGEGPERQKEINERAQALVDAANRGIASLSRADEAIDQIEAELKAMHTDVGRKLDAHRIASPKDFGGADALQAKMKGLGKAIEIVQRVGHARP